MTARTPDPRVKATDDTRVVHPSHYNEHPSGVECWQLTERLSFNLGNAIKYLWRAGAKHDAQCGIYVGNLWAQWTPENAPIAHRADLPCTHCAHLDREKAANYLRTEGARLSNVLAMHAHVVSMMDTAPLMRKVITADSQSLLGRVLQALVDKNDPAEIAPMIGTQSP